MATAQEIKHVQACNSKFKRETRTSRHTLLGYGSKCFGCNPLSTARALVVPGGCGGGIISSTRSTSSRGSARIVVRSGGGGDRTGFLGFFAANRVDGALREG
jgi:hypothetical protein